MSVFVKATASRSRSVKSVLGGVALVGASALVLTGCAAPAAEGESGGTPGETLELNIGTVLPETGSLAFLGPPEEAGVALAVKEINDADLGIKVNVTYGDSGDADNKAYATTVPKLLDSGVSAIIGAASSGVSFKFIDDVVDAGVIQFSPANTSPDFTTYDDKGLYFRTAPSDLLQGEVLGNLIAEDGNETLGIIYQNDAYGTGLEKVVNEVFTAAGGKVVASESYNDGDVTFDAQISTVTAANPDAIILITFNQIYTIAPALAAVGFPSDKLYLVDGNLKQFGTEADATAGTPAMPAGVVTGAKGTTPGPVLADDFKARLNDNWVAEGNAELTDYSYAAESYDAVVLLALAALAAQSTEGADIAAKLQEVSGGSGDGKKATSFADAAKIINAGEVVDYDGYSGGVKFDDAGDPTEASIGIFQYDDTNHFTRIND
ncbi:MAG: amino acid ABC transporter substrate-binding protein [Micrococcales bacterium 70-64]|mgnify:CR=1 FL=1|nr:ABC transporter substrate-binding protein [Leifsonia sp.]ODU63245.1 MAG: amino acid ABC transporter substrate-binding protein [Leifsonia sp. SCN 70-46]OJX84936.1 MAG: amino acid ABC transporter substrate-binding protein [Micrococcales bacterium 70-64]